MFKHLLSQCFQELQRSENVPLTFFEVSCSHPGTGCVWHPIQSVEKNRSCLPTGSVVFVLAQCVLRALILGMCVPRCGWEECVTLTTRVSPHRPRSNSSRCMPLFKCQCCRRLHKLGAGGERERKSTQISTLIGVQSAPIVAGTIPDMSKWSRRG